MKLGPFTLNEVHCGDSLEMLKRLPDECVHVCVTSPPYWGLRDYGLPPSIWDGDSNCRHEFEDLPKISTGPGGSDKQRSIRGSCFSASGGSFCLKCGAWRGCLGLEPTPEMYVEHLVKILMEVRRVLRSDGTLWLNLGDSFVSAKSRHSSNVQTLSNGKYRGEPLNGSRPDLRGHPVLKDKDLAGIPWRVAFALQSAGWWLRQDIIWHKPCPLPESVTDRCTKAHEYIFLLAKSARYFYDAEAVKEKSKSEGSVHVHKAGNKMSTVANDPMHATKPQHTIVTGPYRNRRSVWMVPTKPFRGAHFATFPFGIVEPCIRAGSSAYGCCPVCGAPWKRQIETIGYDRQRWKPGEDQYHTKAKGKHGKTSSFTTGDVAIKETVGWRPGCDCGREPVPCVVLDPFAGSGTTGIVALQEGRNFIGFDLSEKYCREIANPRIEDSLRNRNLPLFDRGSSTPRKIA